MCLLLFTNVAFAGGASTAASMHLLVDQPQQQQPQVQVQPREINMPEQLQQPFIIFILMAIMWLIFE